MKERPIIFSAESVKATLAGAKTQTRRVIKPQPKGERQAIMVASNGTFTYEDWDGSSGIQKLAKYQVGDRLWVRETHYRWGQWVRNGFTKTDRQKWTFKATSNTVGGLRFPDNHPPFGVSDRTQVGWHKRPSIHMPRWASRITLEVTSVRVERVQEIREADAVAEGVDRKAVAAPGGFFPTDFRSGTYRFGFAQLWDSLNAKKGYGWDSNCWCWVINFKEVKDVRGTK